MKKKRTEPASPGMCLLQPCQCGPSFLLHFNKKTKARGQRNKKIPHLYYRYFTAYKSHKRGNENVIRTTVSRHGTQGLKHRPPRLRCKVQLSASKHWGAGTRGWAYQRRVSWLTSAAGRFQKTKKQKQPKNQTD